MSPYDPIGWYADELRISAIMTDAEIVAVNDHLIAGFEAGVGGRFHSARHIDAGNGRKLAHDFSATMRQRIFVVDGRIFGLDDDVSRVQLVYRHIREPAGHETAFLVRAVCLERLHSIY